MTLTFGETARYARQAGKDITETDVRDRYEDYVRRYGLDKALVALQNTLKAFKEQARKEEARLFCLVKADCLQRFGVAPANRRTLGAELQENPDRYGSVPSVQEYRRRFL
ncbi:MAG: hypothetical protein IMW95_12365 [Moorella humiferrea]|nr:hypothetical protein [Moorella humiferrea]